MYPRAFKLICKKAILAGWLMLAACAVQAIGLRPVPERALGFYPYNTIGRVVASDGTTAIGTAISDRHVITSASVFRNALTDGVSQVRWFPLSAQSNGEYSATVKSATFAPGFLEAGSTLQAFQHDLVIMELDGDAGVAVHPYVNVGKLREKAYRKVVSLGAGLYLPGSNLRDVIHATRNGEPAEATFQQVVGKLYQTNQLKGAPEGRGAPVFSFYDRNWSIDGWVAGYEASTGNLLVMENDATSFEFIESVLAASNAKRIFPIEVSRSSHDFNSTTRGAIPLPLGHAFKFSINPGSDVDYHSVKLTESGTYRIESFGPIDVSGALLNRNQQLISSDDDSGESLNYRIQSLLEPGDYFIKTSPYSAQERGDYGLSVMRIDDATVYKDDGFGPSAVMELALNSTRLSNRISTANEVDYFRIRVTAPGHFILWTESQLDTEASVFTVQPWQRSPFQFSSSGACACLQRRCTWPVPQRVTRRVSRSRRIRGCDRSAKRWRVGSLPAIHSLCPIEPGCG
jgi:hypothetical protein